MRVLVVVGPYPPEPGPAARRALAEVARLCAAGHQVEVLSGRASAAHHHRRLAGLRGAAALARRARSYDALVLRLGPGVVVRPRVAALDAAALALALSAWRRVTLSVDDLDAVGLPPGGRPARALWRRADAIVVATDSARDRLCAVPGIGADRVEVRRDEVRREEVPGGAPVVGESAGAASTGAVGAAAPGGGDPAGVRLGLMLRVRAAAAVSDVVPDAWPRPDAGPPPVPLPTTVPGWCIWLVRKVVRGALGDHADTVLGPVFRARMALAGRRRRG